MVDEKSPLLINGEDTTPQQQSWYQKLRGKLRGQNAVLAGYLVLVVIAGTTNRITFKIMQYSTINYAYFDSQITTFFYVPYVPLL